MIQNSFKIMALIVLMVVGLFVNADVFKSPFLTFELPPNFDCQKKLEQWSCRPNTKKQSEALIVVTAKVLGKGDSLRSFKDYLAQPKQVQARTGNRILSQVVSINEITADNKTWIDATHLNGEFPNFKTRYLATVDGPLAVLISFSAHQSQSRVYDPLFDAAVRSMNTQVPAGIESIAVNEGENTPVGIDANKLFQAESIAEVGHQAITRYSSKLRWLLLGGAILILWLLLQRIARRK